MSPTQVLGISGLVSALALALALLALGWAWRSDRRLRQASAALQRSRAEAQGLAGLLDVWQWRTDAAHRLVELQPPRGMPVLASPLLQGRPLLWEAFEADTEGTLRLRSCLEQRAALADVRVGMPSADGGQGVLRGIAQYDDAGRFAGYLGTARELADRGGELLNELLDTLPTPALRVGLPQAGRAALLNGHNAAAGLWLGDARADKLPWDQVLERLPAALRPVVEHALAHPGTATGAPADNWAVRAHRLAKVQPPADELLLLFHRVEMSTPCADTQRDDQESFCYTVSHDLRAPIRVVEGFTKIVQEDYGRLLDRVGNDHLERVLGATARMNSMIDSLLALSQLSSRPLARQPVNLSQLAGYIIDDLRRQAPEREVVVEIEPGLQAHGDATLLRVVLENLLGNAWKYTGKCRLARIWFESSEHEGRPAVTVRDNGAGFDMRFADRLFGVFQRLHSATDFQGTGVGLASVRRIVRRHGGDIWAEGEVDRGARFQFWLGSDGMR